MPYHFVKYIVLWRIIIGTSVILLVLLITNYHLPFSGVKIVRYDLRAPDGTVSHLYPVARVRDMARADGHTYRPMIEDPVYFDVKTLVPYRAARIELIYENTTSIPLAVGVKLPDGGPSFDLKSFENITQEGKWSQGLASFDLSRASYYNGKYTFAFSVPGLRTENGDGGEVRVSSMTLTLERPALSWDDIAAAVRTH